MKSSQRAVSLKSTNKPDMDDGHPVHIEETPEKLMMQEHNFKVQ